MKIALLTIWHEKNYGAELQAYATIKVLQSFGHDVKMIDVRLSDGKYKSLKGKIADYISLYSPCERKFRHFWRKYIPTTKRYKSLDELKKDPPEADVYIVGSDQVWNPDITENFATLYFLDFGLERVSRISYASSFGVEKWKHEKLTEQINLLLHRFSHLSCRESFGVELLKSNFNLNAEHVLDPTLLFDKYPELTGSIEEKNTLVYYPLSNDEELENYAVKLAHRLNLIPLNNNRETFLLKKIEWNRICVEEWLRNIAQSQFVITRSFHGLAFCIIYQRQFAVLTSRNGRGNRLVSLLCTLGLQDRMYVNVDELNNDTPWNRKIDYKNVSKILGQERDKSINFLKHALNEEKSVNGIL